MKSLDQYSYIILIFNFYFLALTTTNESITWNFCFLPFTEESDNQQYKSIWYCGVQLMWFWKDKAFTVYKMCPRDVDRHPYILPPEPAVECL